MSAYNTREDLFKGPQLSEYVSIGRVHLGASVIILNLIT